MNFAILCNPENRRATYFKEAVKQAGFAAPFVISYQDVLTGKVNLSEAFGEEEWVLRIESPGENFELHRQLLALGAEHEQLGNAERIAAADALLLPEDYGRVRYLRQAHLGYERFLENLKLLLNEKPRLRLMNSIESILLSFDKVKCHKQLQAAGVSVPSALYDVQNYDDLRQKMQENRWNQVFIKPLNGSSASGIVAYRIAGEKELAISSAELLRENDNLLIYNSLEVSRYDKKEDIRDLINFLTKETVIVERWMPKAAFEDAVFDLRIVVIDGKARHTVMRESKSPMTNLHLGNKRGDLELLKEMIGTDTWQLLCRTAEKAVAAMPKMRYAGVDIMLAANMRDVYVLEINAFGDLLPGVLVDGMDTYSMEVFVLSREY